MTLVKGAHLTDAYDAPVPPPRLSLVSSAPPGAPAAYRGMDRAPLAPGGPVPEATVAHVCELESLDPRAALTRLVQITARLRAELPHEPLDLLWLGDQAPSDWEPLGFDVGETTPAAWSAIARWPAFMPAPEAARWAARLNTHGLFTRHEDARSHLDRYLTGEDPDRGWTHDGRPETPDLYAVVPIRRLPDNWPDNWPHNGRESTNAGGVCRCER